MLKRLVIRDYLLVRDVTLDFASGLTVITGETGAGKSMIIGALEVMLGEKPPRDAVAQGAEKAIIEAEFLPHRPEDLSEWLAERGDEAREGEIVIRREISRSGRTRSWLNDHPLPQEALQRLGELLVDFHGQREHQSLFQPVQQLGYVDAFAGGAALVERVSRLYHRCAAARRQLGRSQALLDDFQKDRALLEYQLQEIERLGLKPGDEAAIEARLAKLESAEKLAVEASRLLGLLSEADESLVTQVGQARSISAAIARTDPDLKPVSDELADLASRLKDLALQVQHYWEGLAFDEPELGRLRERRSALWELRRKHGLTLEQILERAERMKARLAEGETLAETRRTQQRDLGTAESELMSVAKELSHRRRSATAKFAKQVLELLPQLGFSSSRFDVQWRIPDEPWSPDDVSVLGVDRIEFLFSANPGTPLTPLRDVASGGESSRVTLAIKTVLSERAAYPLMVYDEIDLGISGRVADQVGRLLSQLGQRHQALVVTHLPQIASRADHHLTVNKVAREESTETTAMFLTRAERVKAVAALMAGMDITDTTLASASELLNQP